ncbi:MAG: zinc-dependent metalloprotease [Actinomycetes bacterium]
MSDSGPFGPGSSDDDPFGALNFFLRDIGRMFSGGGADSWETAAQLAGSVANEGRTDPNVDPADRIAVEQLARVAELQVQDVTGLGGDGTIRVEALNRTQWARRFLSDHRPLLERISSSVEAALRAQLGQLGEEGADGHPAMGLPGLGGLPTGPMLEQLMGMMGPMMLGMMAGTTAGHVAARALGHYELPIPRAEDAPLTLVLANVDEFAEAWSLPADTVRLWVCLSDVAHHQVLAVPHVRTLLTDLLTEYASSFSTDPEEIERRISSLGIDELLGGSEPEMEALQQLAGDPDLLLGAMQSDHQRVLMVQIDTLVATVEGYVDHVLDTVGERLLPEYGQVTEALRRRRVEAGPASRFVERLFGLELSQATFDRGAAFVSGIAARGGEQAVARLWHDPEHLPTPAELDAPGLWLARLGIESADVDLPEGLEIPDFPDLDL